MGEGGGGGSGRNRLPKLSLHVIDQFVLSGFTTAFGDYYLKEPHEEYVSSISVLWEKISMTKYSVQFLCDNLESSYEDLLEYLQNVTPPDRVSPFTEDSFLRHAQFIVDQVRLAYES